MAALTSFFTQLKIISNGFLLSPNQMKCVHERVLINEKPNERLFSKIQLQFTDGNCKMAVLGTLCLLG